ncbi:hypothetical protein PM082_015375 [Marasmius tenuissimus]|nr:hypothetical protein PM082_015375 [Marasmius tenuissimus]
MISRPSVTLCLVMASLLSAYTVFRNNSYLFRTSDGNSLDTRNRDLDASCDSLIGLLSEIGACSNSYQQSHHFDANAIYHFLGNTPISQDPSLGQDHLFNAPNQTMRALKTDHWNQRWEPVEPNLVPRELGNVELYRPAGLVKDHSFSFGDAIIGRDAGFHRAVLIGVIHERLPDKTYLLAQTDQRNRVIVIEVPSESVIPRWPPIHSPHLQLIANIAPDVAGLSKTGNHAIRQRVATLCTPSYATRSRFPGHNFQESPGIDEEWIEPNPSFPVLAKPFGLGDWLQTHSYVRREMEPTAMAPSARESSILEHEYTWPRPPSHPNLGFADNTSASTIRLPPVPQLPAYPPQAYYTPTSSTNFSMSTTMGNPWPSHLPEDKPLVSEEYRLRGGRVTCQTALDEIVDEENRQMHLRGIFPRRSRPRHIQNHGTITTLSHDLHWSPTATIRTHPPISIRNRLRLWWWSLRRQTINLKRRLLS